MTSIFRPTTRLLGRQLPRLTNTTKYSIAQQPRLTIPLSQQTRCKTTNAESTIPMRDRPTSIPAGRNSDGAANSDPSDIYAKGAPSQPSPSETLESGIDPSTLYKFTDIQSFTRSPSSSRILIDVREPGELLENGKIPTSVNVPISSAPDSFFMSAEDFEEKFGFERPDNKSGVEVVFYCKAGVRSKAAARLAGQAGFGGKVSEYPGSFSDWVASGGEVERV